tara:strand:- start:75 stop:257 length:183 start_codon:yes stop_codon:yes gene_type:complete
MDKDNIQAVKKHVMLSGEQANLEVTLTDGVKLYVPHATDNSDYQIVQAWVADGNTIAEAD